MVCFDRWIQRGAPVRQRGAKGVAWELDLLELAIWRYGNQQSDGDGEAFNPDKLDPKQRKDWYDSEYRKSQLMERNGELIPVLDYQREMAGVVKTLVSGLQTLPDILERDAGLTGEAVVRAQSVIDALRERLHQELSDQPAL